MIKVKGRPVTINRKSVRARLAEQAAKAKQDLKDELAANTSRVSLAMDGWTSRLNNSYLGMAPCSIQNGHLIPYLFILYVTTIADDQPSHVIGLMKTLSYMMLF